MFNGDGLAKLLKANEKVLSDLVALEKTLNHRFADMEEPIRCLMLAAASGEAMLLVGPPGTAKSRLIRVFCMLTGILEDDSRVENTAEATLAQPALREIKRHSGYFTYLLTQFTEPAELFGYFDIAALTGPNPELKKLDQHAMQRARVVFLDEVFNASSAILNALLTFLNEREIHDRGKIYRTPVQNVFGATNQVPNGGDLAAVYDRFLLRCRIENIAAEPVKLTRLFKMGWTESYAPGQTDGAEEYRKTFPDLLDGLLRMQTQIGVLATQGELTIDTGSKLFGELADILQQTRDLELTEGSNRRVIKFARIMMLNRLLSYATDGQFSVLAPSVTQEDLLLLLRFGLDRPDRPLFTAYQKKFGLL
jgi:MoxR-like ATPase